MAADFLHGEAGLGSEGATIRLRDLSATRCLVAGPMLVDGLDGAGHRVTEIGTVAVAPDLVLSARAPFVPTGDEWTVHEVDAEILISTEYRDDPRGLHGMCGGRDVIIPAVWRVEFSPEHVVMEVRNDDPHDPRSEWARLMTCRGEINRENVAN